MKIHPILLAIGFILNLIGGTIEFFLGQDMKASISLIIGLLFLILYTLETNKK